jgi:hypothetical protein
MPSPENRYQKETVESSPKSTDNIEQKKSLDFINKEQTGRLKEQKTRDKKESENKLRESSQSIGDNMRLHMSELKKIDLLPTEAERIIAREKYVGAMKQSNQKYSTSINEKESQEIKHQIDKIKKFSPKKKKESQAKYLAEKKQEAQANNIEYEVLKLYSEKLLNEAEVVRASMVFGEKSLKDLPLEDKTAKQKKEEAAIMKKIESLDEGFTKRLGQKNRLAEIATAQKYDTVEKHLASNDGEINEAKLQAEFNKQMEESLKDEPELLAVYQAVREEVKNDEAASLENKLVVDGSLKKSDAEAITKTIKDLNINPAYASQSITTDQEGNVCFESSAQQLDGIVTQYNFLIQTDGSIVVSHDHFEATCKSDDLDEVIKQGELYSVFYAPIAQIDTSRQEKEVEALESEQNKKIINDYVRLFQKNYNGDKNVFSVFQKITEQLFVSARDQNKTVGGYLFEKMNKQGRKQQKNIVNNAITAAERSLSDGEKDLAAEMNSNQVEV